MYAMNYQCMLGLACKSFAMIASDQVSYAGIGIITHDDDRLLPLSKHQVLGMSGDAGEVLQFSQFIASNLALYETKNGYQLGNTAVVHFTRKTLADWFRISPTMLLRLLVGGYDESQGGQMHLIDFMGSNVKQDFVATGLGGLYCTSILAHHYKADMTESEAYELMQLCIKEIQHRLCLNLPSFRVKVVTKDGISNLPVITTPRVVASPGIHINKCLRQHLC